MEACENCPFYKTEPVPEDLVKEVGVKDWSSCDVDAVGFAAADRIANMNTHILALQKEIENLHMDRLPETATQPKTVLTPDTQTVKTP